MHLMNQINLMNQERIEIDHYSQNLDFLMQLANMKDLMYLGHLMYLEHLKNQESVEIDLDQFEHVELR